jgi:hypothetical protein
MNQLLLILYLVVIGSVSGTFVQRQTNEAPKYQTISGNINNSLNTKKMTTYDIGNPGIGTKMLMGSKPSPLDN